ncbi:MAG: ATP-binding cassette domain-containing protein [Gammaproteobacteria bacterium]
MLELKNLSFGYKKNDDLFSGLDWSITNGGICGLLGKNGAGKTTLLKIVAGLVFPQHGECQVINYSPKQREPGFLADIYFLPEDIFVPAVTIAEYIDYYARFYPRFNHAQFANYVAELSLVKDTRLTDFSHGQKKKFLIAFGLATNCKILILDEPTNGLDIPSKSEFKKLLASIIADDKLIIISTHQVHDIENLIDSIVVLDDGKIVFNQSMYEISRQLSFKMLTEEPDTAASLYYEKRLGGYVTVMENDSEQDTQIDLEILFNAILVNKTRLQECFEGAGA